MENTPSTNKNTKLIIASLAIIGLGLVGSTAYSFMTTGGLRTDIDKLKSEVSSLSKTSSTKDSKTSSETSTTDTPSTSPNTTDTSSNKQASKDTTDSNFTAQKPDGGFMSTTQALVTFEWTPHKLANKYLVEIKYAGQGSYPASTPADQTVTVDASKPLPAKYSLQKTLAEGDYVWRVTAMKDTTVLQSTEDRNYQYHRH